MPRRILFIASLLFFTVGHAAQNRTALVIGNSDYAVQPLKNPVNDARLMAETLTRQGFDVTTRINVNRRGMKEAIQSFIAKLDNNSVGLFYFAGHGLEVQGRNYLVPINASIASEADVEFEAIDAGRVLSGFEVANNGLNMLILDACRNNPYSRGFRSGNSRGLQPMRPASGSLVLYATEPGEVADDGVGADNGLFTAKLVQAINTPGLKIEDVFKQTAIEVHQQSGKQQTPYLEGVILGDFYFTQPGGEQGKVQLAGGTLQQARPQPGLATGTLVITSDPAGARISLDGGDVGSAPVTIPQLRGGNYLLKAEKPGYRSESQKIFVIGGQERTVNFILDSLSQPAQSHPFTIKVTPSNARVRIMNINPRYQDGMELADGDYDVLVDAPGYHSWRQTISHAGRATWQQVTLTAKPAATASGSFTDPATGMDFVAIEGGCFQMGSPASETGRDDDERQHRVCVEDFSMGKHEVTVGQFRRFISATGYRTDAQKDSGGRDGCFSLKDNMWHYVDGRDWTNPGYTQNDNHPVACVSWNDVSEFVAWLNRQGSRSYRLPIEAEWEYAARGGTTTARHWGNNPDVACRYANVADTNRSDGINWGTNHDCDDGVNLGTAAVGSYQANGFGLKDMLGNLWEWTCSSYDEGYDGAEQSCSARADSGKRALRGGSWSLKPAGVRAANRNWNNPVSRFDYYGFRLVSPAR
jgi:formylglycine-generating enzyme required for sulfatase activity